MKKTKACKHEDVEPLWCGGREDYTWCPDCRVHLNDACRHRSGYEKL